MADFQRRRTNGEGSVYRRFLKNEHGEKVFNGYGAEVPVYDPIARELVKRVYGYGRSADGAVKRRNFKAQELYRELGLGSTETSAVALRLAQDFEDKSIQENSKSVYEFANEWIRELEAKDGVRESSVDTNRSHVDLHINRHLGNLLPPRTLQARYCAPISIHFPFHTLVKEPLKRGCFRSA